MPDEANQDTARSASPADAHRVAIYTRVSTRRQIDGTSLEAQLAVCRAEAERRGWRVVAEFSDRGVSGEKVSLGERGEGRRLLELCRGGGADLVLADDTDRLGRDTLELLLAQRELKEAGADIICVGDSIDARRDGGQVMFELRAALAAEENRHRVKRAVKGLRARAQDGFWTGGPPPYGFRLEETGVTVRGRKLQRLGIAEDEAAVLRRAVELIVDEGHTTWSTARILNQLELPPRKSERWVHQNLRRTLHSPTLGGTWIYESREGAIEVEVPAILEPERFAALQDALGAASTGPKDPAGSRYYLLSRGRLIGMCGAPYHGAWRRERESRSYRCNNSRPEAEPRCLDHNINADMVEQTVWSEVAAMLSEPERLMQMADDYLGLQDAQTDAQEDQLEAVGRKLAALQEARTDRVAQALKAGVDAAVLRDAVAELAADERALLAHKARLEEWREAGLAGSERARRLQELALAARKRMALMAPEERRAVLDLLDVRVTVTGWAECENCEGRGRVKGGPGGMPCPVCRALRRVPSFRIEGVVLDSLDLADERAAASAAPIPFKLELAAG